MTRRYRDGDLVVEDVEGVPLYRVRLTTVDETLEFEGTGEDTATALRALAREVES